MLSLLLVCSTQMAYTEKNGLQVEVYWIHDDEDLLIFVHQTRRFSQFTSGVVLYPAVVAEEGRG